MTTKQCMGCGIRQDNKVMTELGYTGQDQGGHLRLLTMWWCDDCREPDEDDQ